MRTSSTKLIIASFLLVLASAFTQDIRPATPNASIPQSEIRNVGFLFLDDGQVEEFGYMKYPLKVFNQYAMTPDQVSRLKKWDVFDVNSNEFFLSIQVANFGSTGLVRVNFVDYKTGKTIDFATQPQGEKIPRLSLSTYRFTNGTADDITFESDEIVFKVHNDDIETYSEFFTKNIKLSLPSHDLNLDLTVRLSSDHESLGNLSPLDKMGRRFYYDVNTASLSSKGSLRVAGKDYTIAPDTAVAGHYYGRGVFSDSAYIVRAKAQGFLGSGKRFSLFLSSGYGEGSIAEATGDGFVLDKHALKLNAVAVKFNENDLSEPFKFDTIYNYKKNFKETHVTFTPAHNDKQTVVAENTSAESSIVIGTFSGYVTDYKNKKYSFSDLKGSVEILKLKIQV